jgi:CRISPR-associated endonuclease Csn1
LSIQRIKSGNNEFEYGVIMLRFNKEARKSDEIKKDNFKPDGVFKLGEIKPTRKMNHSQFTAFLEGIVFKVLTTGKIQKL